MSRGNVFSLSEFQEDLYVGMNATFAGGKSSHGIARWFTSGATSSVLAGDLPGSVRFYPSAPNPFRETTQIRFELATSDVIGLSVHDLAGRLVRTIDHSTRPSGRHLVRWDGRDDSGSAVGSGVYFLRLNPRAPRAFSEPRRSSE